MKETLKILNKMVSDEVVCTYAIGGAMGALFYTEPFATLDLDVFVLLSEVDDPLISLSPIYRYLRKIGFHETHGECIIIEGVPVQFLPSTPGLLNEALEQALILDYDGTPVSVMRVEHLLAICVATGRPKDRARIPLLMESGRIDKAILSDILSRYQLNEKWTQWTA